ncbi:hypothetical protein D3C71_2229500 [compost metagenome]
MGCSKVHIEPPRYLTILVLQIEGTYLVALHSGLIAKTAGADDAVLPVPAVANAIDVDPVE